MLERILEEKMEKNFPNLIKNINPDIQEINNYKQDKLKEIHTLTHHNQEQGILKAY